MHYKHNDGLKAVSGNIREAADRLKQAEEIFDKAVKEMEKQHAGDRDDRAKSAVELNGFWDFLDMGAIGKTAQQAVSALNNLAYELRHYPQIKASVIETMAQEIEDSQMPYFFASVNTQVLRELLRCLFRVPDQLGSFPPETVSADELKDRGRDDDN